jgi:hypothetical protein
MREEQVNDGPLELHDHLMVDWSRLVDSDLSHHLLRTIRKLESGDGLLHIDPGRR